MPAGVGAERDGEPGADAPGPQLSTPRAIGGAVAAAYACLVLLQFRPFFARFGSHLIGDQGDTLLQHLHVAWQWLALAEGRFGEMLKLPTFHPYSSGLAFGEPLIGVSLPFAPLALLGVSSPATYNSALIAAFLLLGLAIFLWTRELFDSPAAGVLAAVLVVFVPWRVQLLTNLNNMTLHFALIGAWLLLRWARDARPAYLVGAVVAFHIQLITSAQVAVVAIYLHVFAYAVIWASSGFAVERRRCLQLAAASALFLLLASPWWHFFQEAFAAARGLPRTREMQMFSSPVDEMARQFGLRGPLGIFAALSLPALAIATRLRALPHGAGAQMLGLACGAAILFACGVGPYWDAASQTRNPAFAITQTLPLLSAYRAPVRMAAFTPIVAALLAGGGFAVLVLALRERAPRWRHAALCAPLCLAPLWPALNPQMAAPIQERPADLALARALAELPPDAVILSLPMDLEPTGAAVDERVLIHRRAQIGGFASLIPPVFRNSVSDFGQWPSSGRPIVATLGITHIVAPQLWIAGRSAALAEHGYRVVTARGEHAIVAAPPPPPAASETSEVVMPRAAAAGRWLTLARYVTPPRFDKRGHQPIDATWHHTDGTHTRVEAFAMLPGVVSRERPIRFHVPTPTRSGRARLEIQSDLLSVSADVEIEDRPTSFDTPLGPVSVKLVPAAEEATSVRAGAAFPLDVELETAGGPILLASSREALPFRRGETLVLARYRGSRSAARVYATPGLSADLVPGTPARQRWHLAAPAASGSYDLEISFAAQGVRAPPAPWVKLVSGLNVVVD